MSCFTVICLATLFMIQLVASCHGNHLPSGPDRHVGPFETHVQNWERTNNAHYPGAAFGIAHECQPSHNTTYGLFPDRADFYASYLTTLAQSHHTELANLTGLEVGAMHNRAPVPQACNMTYVDAASASDLRKMHPELQSKPIVEPDIVDNVENLASVEDASFDFVIASHLLEHAKNFLRALEALLRVTKSGGMILVTLPNKCFTFDRMRMLTTVRHFVAEYQMPDTVDINNWEHFREWSLSNAHARQATVDAAGVDAAASSFLKVGYHIHYHTFTADSIMHVLSVAQKLLGSAFHVSTIGAAAQEIRVVIIKF